MTITYDAFLETKQKTFVGDGIDVSLEALHPGLFDFQRVLTRWALRKGRAAIFAGCGMGKSWMQLAWADQIPGRVLILAPLSVAQQTVMIAEQMGIKAVYARNEEEARFNKYTVTNYERLKAFDPKNYLGVVADESSCLKAFDSVTTKKMIKTFSDTPYRLSCTATPAPNDVEEFANQAEFLGIMTRQEMLATFFIHDDSGWRLKGHARKPFFRWMASWAMSIDKPSDLGFPDDDFILPELRIQPIIVAADYVPEGQLFATGLKGVGDRSKVRKGTLIERVMVAADMIRSEPFEQWIAWTGLNEESHKLTELLGEEAVEVEGKHSADEKQRRLLSFLAGDKRVLVTKCKVAGFGLNLQNATRQVFVGMNDSEEAWYQAIRRSWRFGQKHPVSVYAVVSDLEMPIYENVQRKEREARMQREELIANVQEFEKEEIATGRQEEEYQEDDAFGQGWHLMLGDSCKRLAEIDTESIDFSVYSPPFASLFVYSNSTRDLGNAADREEFISHYRFIIREMLRVTKPGRNTAVHVQQVATTLAHDGVIGLTDFRGDVIRAYQAEGWIFHGEVVIDKDPQAAAIRTHSKSLLFVQLRRDASWMRPTLADFILVFRKPGENKIPVLPDISNEDWIEWARPIWYGIHESDTLNAAVARENDDERHIAPLQLGTIERCIRLWSNAGETVLSPFAGIGSEGVMSLRTGRQFVGIELKSSYWRTAKRNLEREKLQGQMNLFGEVVTS